MVMHRMMSSTQNHPLLISAELLLLLVMLSLSDHYSISVIYECWELMILFMVHHLFCASCPWAHGRTMWVLVQVFFLSFFFNHESSQALFERLSLLLLRENSVFLIFLMIRWLVSTSQRHILYNQNHFPFHCQWLNCGRQLQMLH